MLPNVIALGLFLFIVFCLGAGVKKFMSSLFARITVYEYQRGLLYREGKMRRVLEAGRYLTFRPWEVTTVVDMRDAVLSLTNQEIVCTDNLGLRLSVAATYRVVDPVKAMHQTQSYYNAIYLEAQLALRDCTAGLKVEEILSRRKELSARFLEIFSGRAKTIGLEVTSGGIRDVTLPADVKKIFSQVSNAEKAGQAALAKARSEVSSLRALANAANMMERNPNLLALRTLQSLSELGTTTGNTIVFGLPPSFGVPFSNGHKQADISAPAEEQGS